MPPPPDSKKFQIDFSGLRLREGMRKEHSTFRPVHESNHPRPWIAPL